MKKLLTGIAVGSVLGGIAALLAAPKKGSELREDIQGSYEKAKEFSKNTAGKIKKRSVEVQVVEPKTEQPQQAENKVEEKVEKQEKAAETQKPQNKQVG